MIGIIYGSSMGNTEEAANIIAENLGLDNEVASIADLSASDVSAYDALILGTSTWGSGDLQDDWDSFDLDSLEVSGKTVAIFGLGDSASYSDTFCNAMAEIYEVLKNKGANIVGSVDAKGYDFEESEAVIDGKFVGLALDADNESDKTQDRIIDWLDEIRPEFSK